MRVFLLNLKSHGLIFLIIWDSRPAFLLLGPSRATSFNELIEKSRRVQKYKFF